MKCSESKRNTAKMFCSMTGVRIPDKHSTFFQSLWFLFGAWLLASLTNTFVEEVFDEEVKYVNGSYVGHSRSKRFIYMGNDRRLNLPPHSVLEMESTASLPGFNPLPVGLGNEFAISVPFDIDFDTLGLTSEDNTFGRIPFLDTIREWFEPVGNFTSSVKDSYQEHHDFYYNHTYSKYALERSNSGGHRSLVYQVIEDALYNLGMNGKACLLRTICELHTQPLFGYGLVGEIIELFLTVSSSDDPLNILEDYLEAELNGKSSTGCRRYKEDCPLSLFRRPSKKHRLREEKVRQKFMDDESNYADYHLEGENNGNHLTREVVRHMKINKTARHTLSREKRFIFFGPGGALRLPYGSVFVVKPNLLLPFMTNLPKGYKSKLKVGIPFKVKFDYLGLTTLLNPFLRVPFASVLGRKRRSTWKPLPGVNYDGGDREYIYSVLEHMLDSWEFDGQSCLQRAICEAHLWPLNNHGLFGEVFQLFFTPSKSLHARYRLKEYVEAENFGKDQEYCEVYYEKCPYSLFITEKQKTNRIEEFDDMTKSADMEVVPFWMM